jgi:hypothetical protein
MEELVEFDLAVGLLHGNDGIAEFVLMTIAAGDYERHRGNGS